MVTPLQVVLITVFVFAFKFIGKGAQLFSYAANVLTGWIVGIIMGDATTGLNVGATMTLMSLGIGGFGGSSVPDYFMGTVIGTIFAVTTGDGVEAALTIGVPVAALGTQLDVLTKTFGSFFVHREIAASDEGKFDQMGFWVFGHLCLEALVYTLPVVLVMTVGVDFITNLIASMPAWLNKGMKTVGGLLPAVGFATLLKYMNMKEYGIYVVLGFVLASYLNLPMLAVAAITLVFAVNEYKALERGSNVAVASTAPTAEDIASGNYDE